MELQGRQDLCGVELHSERRDAAAAAVHPRTHTLEEHRPGAADQVHQSILRTEGLGEETPWTQ